jgi:hypothetical protein
MRAKFSMGDYAVAVKPPEKKDMHGMDRRQVVIIAALRRHRFEDGTVGPAYEVGSGGRGFFYAKPEWLRPQVPHGWAGIPPISIGARTP